MELNEMTLQDVEARLSAIDSEIDAATEVEAVDKLTEEKRSLADRAKELKDLAERKADAMKLESGKETGKPHEEERKMEEKRTFALESAEYREAFLKNLQGKELDQEERAAVTATAAIPTTTMNKIIGIIEKTPLVAAVDLTYIPGNVTYPAEGTINDAAWVAMGTAAIDSADTLNAISLGAYKLIKTVEITADVQAMAIDAFETWLVNRLANKIAKAVDAGIINGGGSTSGQCLGIAVSKSTQDGTYTKNAIKWSDIPKIIGTLKTEYLPNASFVMNRTMFFNKILGLQNSQGSPIVVVNPQAPAQYNLLGFPVIVDDNCTSGDILFGDLKAYKFNFAQAPEVKSDDSVAFRTGSRVYRALALADGKLGDANAIVRFIEAT
jgi:HK97 family phage major capsid protein